MREPLPRVVVVLAIALLAVRLALAAHLELAFDEAYYWTWAHHSALSYYDHPPMVAWFIDIGIAIAGDTEFGVRLLGPFAIFATTLLLMGTVRDLGGGRRAMIFAGLFSELTIAAQVVAIIITPDTPLLFFTALTLRILAAIVAGGPAWLWVAAGAAGGGALLSKYTAVMIGVGILIWLIAVPARRRQLATMWPWAGALAALAVFSPVIVWNARNEWLSFFKQGGRTAEAFQPSFGTFVDFLGSQFALATPVIAVAIGVCLYVLTREAIRQRTDRSVLPTALALPFLLYLIFYSIGGEVEGNWTLVALPGAIVASGLVFEDRRDMLSARRLGQWSIATSALCLVALLAYLLIPFNHSLGRFDITHRLSGHSAVAAEVARIAEHEGLTTVVTEDYGQNALLAFYLPGTFDVIQVDDRDRYRGWTVPEKAAAALANGEVLAVARLDNGAELASYFTEATEVGRVERKHRGTTVDWLILLRVKGFKGKL